MHYLNTKSIFYGFYYCIFGVPEFLQRNAVPQPAARVTGTKQLYPKPSKVRLVSQLVQHTLKHTQTHSLTHEYVFTSSQYETLTQI